MVWVLALLLKVTATPATPPGFCFGGPNVVSAPMSLAWISKYE